MSVQVIDTHTVIPNIQLHLTAEPEFTSSSIEELLSDYVSRTEFRERTKWKLEENFRYFSNLFVQYRKLLLTQTEKLTLLHMKRRFVWICRSYRYTPNDYLLKMQPEHHKYYNYIKIKDPNWQITDDWNLADVWFT